MNYKVYECEESTTKTGKSLKKLVLQGDGKQYPDKNVTMWSDHPLFNVVAVGQTIDVELDVKDSTVPNPHGGFYKNKTVIGRSVTLATVRAQTESPTITITQTYNLINLKVMAKLDRIERLVERSMGLDPQAIDDAVNEVTSSDSPF